MKMKFCCRFIFIFFIICLSVLSSNSHAGTIGSGFINVPLPVFKSTLISTMNLVQNVASSMPRIDIYADVGAENDDDDGRNLSIVMTQCGDVLDSTYEALNLSLSAIQRDPEASYVLQGYEEYNRVDDLISHASTRLNSNLGGQKACMEAFHGTKYSTFSGRFNQVMVMTGKLLSMLEVQFSTLNAAEATAGLNFLQPPDATVCQEGCGNYRSITEAIKAAPSYGQKQYVILVKKGIYNEYVFIDKSKTNLVLIGEGMDATIIYGSRSHGSGWETMSSATFAVAADGFIAMDIAFANTAGPQNGQAVALLCSGDRAAFHRCKITGNQDSLLVHAGRHFFRDCRIAGTVDFIFGYGTAVFQNCDIIVKKNGIRGISVITAHGRSMQDTTGFSFQSCKILPEPHSRGGGGGGDGIQAFLGRPWGQYSRTIFMETYMSNVILPEGWCSWNGGKSKLETLYYGEYNNGGPGAGLAGRVKWAGYHQITSSSEADMFTTAKFIDGDSWLPTTGVPFTNGLY